MSHVVEIRTEVRDAIAVDLACKRLGIASARVADVRLFNATVHGLAVQLPGWRYPIVCDLPSGKVHYDNFEGRWGNTQTLHRFLQSYAVEKTKLEARRHGYMATEQSLSDGSIRVVVQVGGAA